MERRNPLLGLGRLATLLALLIFGWVVRQPPRPENDACPSGAADPVRDAWMVGLAPAAFATACGCVWVTLWVSAGSSGRERPRTVSVVFAAIVLLLGLEWWLDGADSPMAGWAFATLFGVLVTPFVVPVLSFGVWWFARQRRDRWAWRSLRLLCWWSLLILIPAFVAIVSLWGADFSC